MLQTAQNVELQVLSYSSYHHVRQFMTMKFVSFLSHMYIVVQLKV